MDFKEYLDKYVFKASHPLTERAKQREETLKAIIIEEEIKKGKTVAIPTSQKSSGTPPNQKTSTPHNK